MGRPLFFLQGPIGYDCFPKARSDGLASILVSVGPNPLNVKILLHGKEIPPWRTFGTLLIVSSEIIREVDSSTS